jgi:NitT/TauT family transport system substrate-binding protein
MRRVFKRTSLIALAAAIPLVISGCGSSSSGASDGSGNGSSLPSPADGKPAKMTTVTMQVNPYVGTAPIYLGLQQGFFKDENIDLKVTPNSNIAAINTAVIGNKVNLGFATVPQLIQAASKGAKVKCVAPFAGNVSTDKADFSSGMVVRADSGISSPKDLAGKKVAVPALGSQTALMVQAIVGEDGGDWQSVKLVPLTFPLMNDALKKGDVDAIASTQPFINQALASGDKLLVWEEQQLFGGDSLVCVDANDAYIKSNPEVIDGLRAAMEKSIEYTAQHLDEARQTLVQSTGVTSAVAAATPVGVKFVPSLNVASFDAIQQLMVKYGYLDKAIPNSKFVWYPSK